MTSKTRFKRGPSRRFIEPDSSVSRVINKSDRTPNIWWRWKSRLRTCRCSEETSTLRQNRNRMDRHRRDDVCMENKSLCDLIFVYGFNGKHPSIFVHRSGDKARTKNNAKRLTPCGISREIDARISGFSSSPSFWFLNANLVVLELNARSLLLLNHIFHVSRHACAVTVDDAIYECRKANSSAIKGEWKTGLLSYHWFFFRFSKPNCVMTFSAAPLKASSISLLEKAAHCTYRSVWSWTLMKLLRI